MYDRCMTEVFLTEHCTIEVRPMYDRGFLYLLHPSDRRRRRARVVAPVVVEDFLPTGRRAAVLPRKRLHLRYKVAH